MVDAPASGAGILTGVEVRVFSWAPKINNIPHGLNLAGFLLLPEGGWVGIPPRTGQAQGFNTQLPEGGCGHIKLAYLSVLVSTHSHPKVAAEYEIREARITSVSTHSHPKVAARGGHGNSPVSMVSTHSHPKVAATYLPNNAKTTCFNTQPPEGGYNI